MVTSPELIEYIKGARSRGVSDAAIAGVLKNNGWTDNDISEAYAALPKEILFTNPPPTPQQFLSEKNSPPQHHGLPGVNYEKKPESKIFRNLAILVIILLVLGGGGVFAYYNYEDILSTPEDKIVKSILSLQNISGVTTDTTLSLKNKDGDAIIQVEGSLYKGEGTTDIKETGKISIDTYYRFPFSLSSSSPSLSSSSPYFSSNSAVKLSIVLNVRLINKTLYLMIDKETNFDWLAPLGLDGLKDKWVQFSLSDASNLSNKSPLKVDNFGILSSDEIKVINKKYENVDRLIIDKKGKEKINGINTNYYAFHFGPEMKSFLKDLLAESLIKNVATNKEIEENKAEFDKVFESILNHSGEIWIGNDGLPNKVVFKATVKSIENSFVKDLETAVDLEVNLKDFNRDISVNVPEESKTFEEIMQTFFLPQITATTTLSD